MTNSNDFTFLKCRKEVIVIWALEMCRNMFKDQENMSQVIVIDHNSILMNSIANVFYMSYIFTMLVSYNKKCER